MKSEPTGGEGPDVSDGIVKKMAGRDGLANQHMGGRDGHKRRRKEHRGRKHKRRK